jgi:hypothetical protein
MLTSLAAGQRTGGEVDHDGALAAEAAEVQRIVARAAVDLVFAVARRAAPPHDEGVVAVHAGQDVVARAARDRIVAAEAVDKVRTGGAGEAVVEVVVQGDGVAAEEKLAAVGEAHVGGGKLQRARVE